MSLDRDHPSPAYQLGRLFSLLERIQQNALDPENKGTINASIADRFLGSAMTTPKLIFPRLLKLMHHHQRKLADTNKSAHIYWDKLLLEIQGRFSSSPDSPADYPRILKLEEQGAFILGYHHQRAEFFRKKDDAAAPPTTNANV